MERSVGVRLRKWNATVDVHATVTVELCEGRNRRCLVSSTKLAQDKLGQLAELQDELGRLAKQQRR